MRLVFSLTFTIVVSINGMGTQFLSLPIDAEELSLGSHPTLKGISPVNPAMNVASVQHPTMIIGRGNWLGDVSLTQIGYSQDLSHKTFHIRLRYAGLQELELRDDRPSDESLAQFSTYGVSADFGFSIEKGNRKYGMSISGIMMGLYTESSSGIGINMGYVNQLSPSLSFGAVVLNLGKMTKLSTDEPSLPLRLIGGLSKELSFGDNKNELYFSAEWNHLASKRKITIGNSFRWNRLRLMGGFSGSESVVQSSAGFGIQVGQYRFSYGIIFGSQNLGVPQTLTFHLTLP